jgi:multiple sugar transport system substrate-binding protein
MEDVLATGQNIDIVLLSIGFVPEYVKYNLQYDHNDLIKKYNFDLNRLEQTTVDFIKRFGDGKMYALPIFTTAEVLMYNKDLFDKFGVPYPKAGMTWDETFDLAKKMTRTEGGVQYYGFGMSVGHMLRVNQLSLPFVDPATGQPAIANDAFRKLLENFARFYTLPGASALLKNTANFFTKDKTLAMYAYFNSTMVSAPPEMNVDAVPLPSFPEARGTGSQMYPTYAGVSSISKHKDAAFQVLAYLTSEEMQTEFAKDGTGLPVVKNPGIIEVFGQNLPHLKGKNIKAFYPEKPAPIAPKTLYDDLAEKRAGEAFNQVAQNQKDAVTALREAAENASKDIEAAKGK